MADSQEKKDDVGGTGKSPGGSKLDSLSREDLLKFVKKQTVLLQKYRTKCDELTKKIAEVESTNTAKNKNNLDKIQKLEVALKDSEDRKEEALAAYNAVQQSQESAATQLQNLQEQCNNIKQEKELICQKFVQFEKKNKWALPMMVTSRRHLSMVDVLVTIDDI